MAAWRYLHSFADAATAERRSTIDRKRRTAGLARRSFHAGRSRRIAIGPAQCRTVRAYHPKACGGDVRAAGASNHIWRRKARRLANGAPHEIASETPTSSIADRRKP